MANILVVDDSMLERSILSDIMTSLGHNVVAQAKNGEDAIEEYKRLKPDLVTMDLTMKGIGGAEAISKILEFDSEACIVAVSSHQEKKIIFDAMQRGCRHYIIKPLSLETVSAAMSEVLQQSFDTTKKKEVLNRFKQTLEKEEKVQNHRAARILITDDSAFARKRLRDVATALGHMVVGEATNGTQAFVEYARLKPDLITMDLTMQGMSGVEAISKIKAAYPDACIIVVSAIDNRANIINALERGARHFIVKPIRQDKVADIIESVLRQDFDPQKHRNKIQALKAKEAVQGSVDAVPEYIPPYSIVPADNHFTHLFINESLNFTSFQTMLSELEEHLGDDPNVLIDFGATKKLEPKLLELFNKLIQTIETNEGVIQARSSNPVFLSNIVSLQAENSYNPLAELLRNKDK